MVDPTPKDPIFRYFCIAVTLVTVLCTAPIGLTYLWQRRFDGAVASIERLGGQVDAIRGCVTLPIESGDEELAAVCQDMKYLPGFRYLDLTGTSITDTGLMHLRGLTDLSTLDLSHTKISDAGLANLHGLKDLRSLGLRDVQFAQATIDKLMPGSPYLSVYNPRVPSFDGKLRVVYLLGEEGFGSRYLNGYEIRSEIREGLELSAVRVHQILSNPKTYGIHGCMCYEPHIALQFGYYDLLVVFDPGHAWIEFHEGGEKWWGGLSSQGIADLEAISEELFPNNTELTVAQH